MKIIQSPPHLSNIAEYEKFFEALAQKLSEQTSVRFPKYLLDGLERFERENAEGEYFSQFQQIVICWKDISSNGMAELIAIKKATKTLYQVAASETTEMLVFA